MPCPRCRHQNAPHVKFCGECGARLVTVCAVCRTPNPPTNKFCQECGTALAAGGPEAKFASPDAYTPAHLAKKILTARGSPGGERKQVTVLFADLKGSLELLADRDPEDARALLDGVLERMMEAVHRFEGTVNQVMGDGVMALFGAPLAHEDHAVRACYAALRMHAAVARYAEELQRLQGIDVQIRAGLNSGEVVVRSIGSDLDMDYSAVGQTTHLAARMEQLARPGTTLITEATRRLAERAIEVEPYGPVPVKGLRQPVEVFELRAARPAHSRVKAASARALTRFIGRTDELADLQRRLERAGAGHGQVVAVVGEAGVGKSRFLREFTHSERSAGWEVLEGEAISYGGVTPYLAVATILQTYFQVEPGDDDAAHVRGKVSGRLLALDAGLHWAVPALLALGNLPAHDAEWEALDPPERRRRIFRAVTEVLLRESEIRPLLVVVENLHWADSETRAWLDGFVPAVAAARLLLVVSSRREHRPRWDGVRHAAELRLRPFSGAHAAALLDDVLGSDPALAGLKALLVERTGGNPFFLEESVRALVETQGLAGERGGYRPGRPLATIQIPDRVQAVVAARIDRLSDGDKRLLQAGAVIGKDLPFPLLQAVVDLPTGQLLDSLAELEAAEFLQTTSLFPELAHSFKHTLTHDVVYTSLLKEQRRPLHARILDALETLYPDRGAEHAERLAHHALGAELWYEAVAHLRAAGAKAVARSANVEAVRFLEAALEAVQHLPPGPHTAAQGIDVRLELGPPLLQLGRLDDIARLAREAASMAVDIGDDARLARSDSYLVNYHYLKGEPDAAAEYATRCLVLADQTGDPALATLARRYLGHCFHAQGEHRRAVQVLEENVEALEAVLTSGGTAALTASVASSAWIAFALADLGDFDRAETWADRARTLAETSRHPYSQAIALTFTGLVWGGRGQFDRAVRPLARALAICRERQLAVWQPIPASLLGRCLVHLDRKDDGLALLDEGLRDSRALGVNAYAALWAVHLGEGRLAAGDPAGAGVAAAHALALARAHGERGHEAAALRLLGDVAARREPPDLEAGTAHYRAALARAEELALRPLQALAHLGLGHLRRQAGDRDEAEAHLATSIVLFSDLGMRFWLDRAEPDLKALGQLMIVARPHVDLYRTLADKFAGDPDIRVILDRRAEPRPGGPAPASGAERRRQAIDHAVRSRGLAIVIAG